MAKWLRRWKPSLIFSLISLLTDIVTQPPPPHGNSISNKPIRRKCRAMGWSRPFGPAVESKTPSTALSFFLVNCIGLVYLILFQRLNRAHPRQRRFELLLQEQPLNGRPSDQLGISKNLHHIEERSAFFPFYLFISCVVHSDGIVQELRKSWCKSLEAVSRR